MKSWSNTGAVAVFALIIIGLGAVLGLTGIASLNWLYINDTRVASTSGSGICNMGLWEKCCKISQDSCTPEARTDVEPWMNAMRVMLVIAVAFVFLTILMLLFQIFSDKYGYSEGYQQITSLVMAVGCLMYIMLVIAYGTKEYVISEAIKEEAAEKKITPAYLLLTFGWSFYVTLVGALITPIGVCLVCTHWHSDEDKEAKEGDWTYDPDAMDTRF